MNEVHIVRDPLNRMVSLDGERWSHILDGHPELEGSREDVIRAVEDPSEVVPGRTPGEEWFYLAGVGPSRWLKVIVVFEPAKSGRIITAFGRRRKP